MPKESQSSRSLNKDATHQRIVSVAARAIRRDGYAGTSVADIMKDAGLTHGGFYSHFASREDMLTKAAAQACSEAASQASQILDGSPPDVALKSLLAAYLSKGHVDQLELGCPLAALGSETVRQTPEVRRVATRHIKGMVDLVARQSPDWGQPGAHNRALVTVATMVGALMLSRAVDEPDFSEALCEAAFEHLSQPTTE